MTQTFVFRAPNLSFCELDRRVVVLEPAGGMYYILSNRVAEIVRALPLEEEKIQNSRSNELLERPMLLDALRRAGLVVCSSSLDVEIPALANEFLDSEYAREVTRWGSVTELTQTGGTGYSGGSGPF